MDKKGGTPGLRPFLKSFFSERFWATLSPFRDSVASTCPLLSPVLPPPGRRQVSNFQLVHPPWVEQRASTQQGSHRFLPSPAVSVLPPPGSRQTSNFQLVHPPRVEQRTSTQPGSYRNCQGEARPPIKGRAAGLVHPSGSSSVYVHPLGPHTRWGQKKLKRFLLLRVHPTRAEQVCVHT